MIKEKILASSIQAYRDLYDQSVSIELSGIQKTKKDFEGDYTLNVFPYLKFSRKSPEETASEVGKYLLDNLDEVQKFNVIKGFLNLVISDDFWIGINEEIYTIQDYGIKKGDQTKVSEVIEFSSPNTNKPLHLGHIRNNLLGWSISELLKANGRIVKNVNLVNDRGIHICKTMLAWQKWAGGKTPKDLGIKGDKYVGDLYIRFDKEYKKEINEIKSQGLEGDEADKNSELMKEARLMLSKWEKNDPETLKIWNTMNGWVYEGFDSTYKALGIKFDKTYHESETYLLGKDLVLQGLNKGVFYKKDDGSVWCDLSDEGLDQKLLLRPDGTSVYMTQDLGTAQLRFDDYHPEKLLYVVGNEQNYHFDVLKIILNKLGKHWAKDITHISYGMVELPSGKMKSREGTVVDADDLMSEMYEASKKLTIELGKTEDIDSAEAETLFRQISLGALKYFILKVDPKKNMVFNPEESIDFNGNTGPFIQYTHARICSLLAKAGKIPNQVSKPGVISGKERSIIKLLNDFPGIIDEAGKNYSPALIANYVYELAKEYNQFYQETPVLKAKTEEQKQFRLQLSANTSKVIKSAMKLLGIEVPERM